MKNIKAGLLIGLLISQSGLVAAADAPKQDYSMSGLERKKYALAETYTQECNDKRDNKSKNCTTLRQQYEEAIAYHTLLQQAGKVLPELGTKDTVTVTVPCGIIISKKGKEELKPFVDYFLRENRSYISSSNFDNASSTKVNVQRADSDNTIAAGEEQEFSLTIHGKQGYLYGRVAPKASK